MTATAETTSSKLARPVEMLDGVGSTRAKHFKLLGVRTLSDLLEYFPRTYVFEGSEVAIERLVAGEQIQTARGRVVACDFIPGRPRARFEATLDDRTEKLALVWFNQTWLRTKIVPGMFTRVQGKVRFYRNMPQMVQPKWIQIPEDAERVAESKFRPIYPASAKL